MPECPSLRHSSKIKRCRWGDHDIGAALWWTEVVLQDDAQLWIDGRLLPAREATVAAIDHGLTVGDGAFETLQVIDGRPFAVTRHINRLLTTLEALALPAPDRETLSKAMSEVVAANALTAGRLRLTVTGGDGPLGSGEAYGTVRVIAAAEPPGEEPVPVAVTVPWTRNESGALAGLKTTSYAENVRALRYATSRGAGEALLANTRGRLCEGTGTNVFVVIGGDLLTPPLTTGCLAGVTRALVLEHTSARELDMPYEVLREADDVFLTSSTRNVQILSRVDDREMGPAGRVALDAAAAFEQLLVADLDP